jgi:hypothetical protein
MAPGHGLIIGEYDFDWRISKPAPVSLPALGGLAPLIEIELKN